MDSILRNIKKLIPRRVFIVIQPAYHSILSIVGAVIYGFPARQLYVIGVTGTKGKSSTTEILNTLLVGAGYKTAMTNGIRFKTGDASQLNLLKMTMPGRFMIQKHMRDAVRAGCTHFILEMTSEGTKLSRHKWLSLDALIFTNMSPEHIESHGSYEKYLTAKLKIARELELSKKPERVIVANADDKEAEKFLAMEVSCKIPYSLKDTQTFEETPDGLRFTFERQELFSPLHGTFNLYNILASVLLARHLNVNLESIKKSLATFSKIEGRVEYIDSGQDFEVVVDYAHTADSLEQFYKVFEGKRKICVLGNTGGGRDKWKRPEMGKVADAYCDVIYLTDEDPYDENPAQILEEMKIGITKHEPRVIFDRRSAIRSALSEARSGDAVLITGKGTDPFIMGANGTKTPWSDADVAKEELSPH